MSVDLYKRKLEGHKQEKDDIRKKTGTLYSKQKGKLNI